jgi:hypothetical protein
LRPDQAILSALPKHHAVRILVAQASACGFLVEAAKTPQAEARATEARAVIPSPFLARNLSWFLHGRKERGIPRAKGGPRNDDEESWLIGGARTIIPR